MGLPQNLGRLSAALTSDASLNIGVGVTPSGSFKLEVGTTSKFTGVATFGSTLSNGTYSYTLPGATGTLALTSALSSYVPYTGATANVNLGVYDLDSGNVNINGAGSGGGALRLKQFASSEANREGYNSISTLTSGVFYFTSHIAGSTAPPNYKNFVLNPSGLTDNTLRTYTLPDATGTLALVGGAGVGTVTSVAAITLGTSGTDLSSTVANGTTTPVITLNVPDASATARGVVTTGTQTFAGAKTLTGALNGTSATFSGRIGTSLSSSGVNFANSSLYVNNTANTKGAIFGYNDSADNFYFTALEYGVAYKPILFNTTAATFSSSVAINGSTVSTEGLSVQYNQAKTYTTQTAVSRWHSNEGVGSQFKLNLFAIGNATGSSRVFKFQTSNEGVANDGIIAFQSDGGNVGIGTTSPSNKLHINSTDDNAYALRVQGNTNNESGVWTGIGISGEAANTKSAILFQDNGSSYSRGNLIFAINNAADQTSATPSDAVMTLLANGNVLIGNTTDNGAKLQVSGGDIILTGQSSSKIQLYRAYSGDPANVGLALFNTAGTTTIALNSNGGSMYLLSLGTGLVYSNGGTLTSTNPSDKRLKDNIETLPYGLSEILKIRPVKYNWKDDKINQGVQFGFIAQEVKEIIPEAIKEFGDGIKYLGLEKDAIYATLINAIKELNEKIIQLENKL